VSRLIRNPRARALQGHRAGIVSRALAFAADLGVAFVLTSLLFAGASLLWDLFFSDDLAVPRPASWVSAGAIFVILVLTLGLGWGSTGRSIGKQIVGLRVVRADGAPLEAGQAYLRAFLCALLPVGLLLALFDRRNRSVQDVWCKTVVVYDWVPEAAHVSVPPATPPVMPASVPAPDSGESGA
jgi:uncharacterized RDD family membrane protein YckC